MFSYWLSTILNIIVWGGLGALIGWQLLEAFAIAPLYTYL